MAAASAERARALRQREPLPALRRRAQDTPPAPPLVLSPEGFDLVAEVKRRSPSAGALAPAAADPAGDAAARAAAYARAGAAAVSVLTEPAAFGGALEDLARAARALPGCPVLRKDFLVDEAQLFEARAAGAGGVLLVVRLLPGARLAALLEAAAEAALFVLLEAFDGDELERAAAAARRPGAPRVLLGVNARDLASLAVDPARFARLACALPGDLPVIAESGLATPDDAARAASLGYRGALVGSALMRAADPASRAAAMIRAGRDAAALPRPAKLFVKICGLTEEAAVEAAVRHGADAVGFVLAPSPRRVGLARARALAARVPPGVVRVAVFADAAPDELLAADAALAPDAIQADAGALAAVAGRLRARPLPVVRDGAALDAALDALLAGPAAGALARRAYALLDAARSGAGLAVDRARAAAAARRTPLVLAGGLAPDTVEATIRAVRPAGVDVSSGVESAPGLKDPARIAAFVAAARRAGIAPRTLEEKR
jgi:indole-3-glycerol phosphate synthase/phosphoribosylanthranilate isomerase